MKILTNCKIYSGLEILDNHSIVMNGQTIQDIIHNSNIKDYSDYEIIDLKGENIAPGFIDLQVNGFGGFLLNDDVSEDCLKGIFESSKKYGATTVLPTLITTSDENILKALKLVRDYKDKYQYNIPGLHLEGPYISRTKKGVHNIDHVRGPDSKIIDTIIEYADCVKILTLAPEVCDSSTIKKLANAGITVSLGHTNATYEEAFNGIESGITMATHLYNAMSGYQGRNPGAIGAVLNSSNVYAGIIADGFHLDYSSLEVAKKLLKEKLILVTDAAAPAGTDMEEFVFEGAVVYHKNGKLTTADGTLGGSALTMMGAVKNTVENTFIPLDEALRMASTYAAESINLGNLLGKIKSGYIANLVIFDNSYNISKVVDKGEISTYC
ncbi:N-acetylglucosamine-6-phosphate deacetylase [Francisella marina]|uniref:N-acetylglucosamine-6-phosphate deacetylase n=1 Tax=Francisella marina TaxID=2249302 RepID=A0ABX5ZJJ0_9GAMM|nr:N-acetylglucosamine-6-phosphate deacetylase [Francisella marina]QEO57383.1 N-acetylglucosamine-6-phosphate deacetylase [Francisella marina]